MPVGSNSVDRELCKTEGVPRYCGRCLAAGKQRDYCRKHDPTVPLGQILESNIKTVGGDVDTGHAEQELLRELGAGAQCPLRG